MAANERKKILFVASECVPFIKTGGLADVVGSLPKDIDPEYYDVRVMIPKYSCMKPISPRLACPLFSRSVSGLI